MEYVFYGWQNATVPPLADDCPAIKNPRDLYDALSGIWRPETCAPRLAEKWSPENRTLGQCSITAFLAQDLFGGEVYGIARKDGNVHCYNVVGDAVFDLTSEQFGDEVLDYSLEVNTLQTREKHFADLNKKSRYEQLRGDFLRKFGRKDA